MKKTKTQKGITLIALIITIVVLLILAVVTINAIQGDGIIQYAKNARDEYQTKADEEQETIDGYLSRIESSLNGGTENGNTTVTHSGIIPEGGTYIQGWIVGYTYDDSGAPISWGLISQGTTYNAGQAFPTEVKDGDIYIYGDYEYRYNYVYSSEWESRGMIDGRIAWIPLSDALNPGNSEGWAVKVIDKAKTVYNDIIPSINGKNVTNMYATYSGTQINTLPTIPNSVTNLCSTFSGCNNITSLSDFIIPDSVTCMHDTFAYCGTMDVSEFVIPQNITDVRHMLAGCTFVTGIIKLPCRFMGLSIQNENDGLAWMDFTGNVDYYHLDGCSH